MTIRVPKLLLLLLVLVGSSTTFAGTRPPNIVFILMDDLGWADLGCQGSDFYRTPNIDRLAREGMRFTQAYAASPICSPTRASILTGQHPARLHLTDWLPGRPDRTDQKMKRPAIAISLPAGILTLPRALAAAGYVSAHIGKWHLGGAGSLPQDHGFHVNIAGDQAGTPVSYFAPFRRANGAMPGLEDAPAGEYLTDRLTAEAEKFIGANQGNPFFLYLAHYAPHTPLTAKSNLIAKYRAAAKPGAHHTNAVYAAMIESLDDGVGRILRKLDELHLATNTLVIFTSDNGGLAVREGPATPSTSNHPLRAGKGYLYEGGLRVPLIVRWPGNVTAGILSETPVSSLDFFPTLLTIAGVKLPSDPTIDGVSFLPLLKQSPMADRDPFCWHYPHYANQGGKPGGAIREGNLKLIESYESGYLELYNLRIDPGETNNMAGAQPQRANELAKKLGDWRHRVGAQMMTTNVEYELVPIAPSADGSVVLHAHEVNIHGANLRYEPAAHKNTIGYWTKQDDWASWDFTTARPGRFAVEMLQGCGKGSGGSVVEVAVDGQSLDFTVEDTGHFQNFVAREIGVVRLEKAGRHTLTVKPRTKPGVAVMDLRRVTLKPQGI
ncbi:MAG: arylsulfatase [Verrucomicrobiota bacterium]|jgi:arylsulfatase A-like enzyme